MHAFQLDSFDDVFSQRMHAAEWHRLQNLKAGPFFLNGLFAYRQKMPAYFERNVILNKVVTEAWRFEMLVYTLFLHDSRNVDDPRSGLTVANLQKICAEQNCASRGRVLAIITMMRLAGYLRRTPSQQDGRVVLLEPSEDFLKVVEGWNRRIFEIIDAILPDGRLAERHECERGFGRDMRLRGAKGLLKGWKLLDPFPEVAHFVTRDGGWMLLLTCVADSLRAGEGRRIDPVSIDLAAFGAKFGVSRSHLRRLLESAHAAGLLVDTPRNGARIVPAPQLVASFLNCMAAELAYYNHNAAAC